MAISAGANALGFIFAPSRRQIEPEAARQIISELPGPIETFGVFVNAPVEIICNIVEATGLTGVQLHGEETADSISALRKSLPDKTTIIKVIGVKKNFEQRMLEWMAEGVAPDAFLLDSGVPHSAASLPGADMRPRGGTGRSFDWRFARRRLNSVGDQLPSVRILIAGGLNAGNVGQAIEILHPAGVDVVSGVETEPGKKDPAKLRAFVEAVRAAGAMSASSSARQQDTKKNSSAANK